MAARRKRTAAEKRLLHGAMYGMKVNVGEAKTLERLLRESIEQARNRAIKRVPKQSPLAKVLEEETEEERRIEREIAARVAERERLHNLLHAPKRARKKTKGGTSGRSKLAAAMVKRRQSQRNKDMRSMVDGAGIPRRRIRVRK